MLIKLTSNSTFTSFTASTSNLSSECFSNLYSTCFITIIKEKTSYEYYATLTQQELVSNHLYYKWLQTINISHYF